MRFLIRVIIPRIICVQFFLRTQWLNHLQTTFVTRIYGKFFIIYFVEYIFTQKEVFKISATYETLLISFIFQNRAKSALASAILITLLLVFISAIVILNVETEPTSNIKNSEDALWWSISTVTTVGYGDRYPVTLEGRIVASILMITGIGMVGTISGFVASWFINARKDESN